MAARGRFGRSDTGTSNLSALIRQLVSQQQAAAEQALMNAFYSGQDYNGSVPTMSDVKAFYENYMNVTGIDQGSDNWNIIQQKIGDANNADIKREFDQLSTTFETSNSGNFAEIMKFLKGRAQESTNQDHLNVYNKSISAAAKSFVSDRAADLIGGTIKDDQYQLLVNDALSNLDPADPMRTSILVDSFAARWSAMSKKQWDKVIIGKISASAYASWAKSFASEILSSGLSSENTTYLDALASAKGATGGGNGNGGGAQDAVASTLSSIWTSLKTKYGAKDNNAFFPGQTQTTSAMLKEIATNPDWVQRFASELDSNPSDNKNVWNTSTGKDGGEAFIEWFGGLLSKGVDVTKNSGGNTAQLWLAAEQNAGTSTSWRIIQSATQIWEADIANAHSDMQQLNYLKTELSNFLQGKDSKYGKLPGDATDPKAGVELTSLQRNLVLSQINAINGYYDPVNPPQTISSVGHQDAAEQAALDDLFVSGAAITDAANKLQSGALVNYWTKDDSVEGGHWVADKPTSVGPMNGKYSYVSTVKNEKGDITSQVRVADTYAVQIYNSTTGNYENSAFRYTYIPDSKETIFLDQFGRAYSSDAFTTLGKDGYAVKDLGAMNNSILPDAPKHVYFTDESKGAVLTGPHGPNDPNASMIDAEDRRIAASAALEVAKVGLLDPTARDAVLGPNGDGSSGQIYDVLVATADAQALKDLLATPTDPADLAKRRDIADYSGDKSYADFIQSQIDNPTYKEVAPNVWNPIDPIREIGALNAGAQLSSWFAQQNPIVQTLAGIPTRIAGVALGVAALGDILLGGTNKQTIDKRSPEQKAADNARGLKNAAPQVASYQNTGYGRAPGDQFFRNLSPNTITTAQPLGSSYLGLQAELPKAIAPKAISTGSSAIKITGAPGFGAVISTPPTTTKIINSGPRQGQAAGGGL